MYRWLRDPRSRLVTRGLLPAPAPRPMVAPPNREPCSYPEVAVSRGILKTLVIGIVLYVVVALVMISGGEMTFGESLVLLPLCVLAVAAYRLYSRIHQRAFQAGYDGADRLFSRQ